MTHWAKTQERGSIKGMMFLLYVLKFLGVAVCKVFLVPVLMYFFATKKAPRDHLKQYLSHLHAIDHSQPEPGLVNIFKIYINYGFAIIERIAAWQNKLTIKQVNKHNETLFEDLVRRGQGAILLVSHLGNYEISRVLGSSLSGVKLTVFMHTEQSAKMTRAIKKINPEYDLSVIQGDQLDVKVAMLLKERIDQGEFVVIAGDRVPVDNDQAVLTADFLGHPANFPVGPYVMAKVLQCPIVSLFCLKSDKAYDVYFDLLAESVTFDRHHRDDALREYIHQYTLILTRYVKIAPLQWYNFHNFWLDNTQTRDK